MTLQSNSQCGIEKLIDKYTRQFRIPENLNYYPPDDLARAERQFIKLCLHEGRMPIRKEQNHET